MYESVAICHASLIVGHHEFFIVKPVKEVNYVKTSDLSGSLMINRLLQQAIPKWGSALLSLDLCSLCRRPMLHVCPSVTAYCANNMYIKRLGLEVPVNGEQVSNPAEFKAVCIIAHQFHVKQVGAMFLLRA